MDGSAFPPGVADKIKTIGARFDEEVNAATRALYGPLVTKQESAGIAVTSDIAYGAAPRQKLDLYRPQGQRLPVVVYIPGGGYIGGDKNMDGVFYRNLGTYFARHGFLTVVANYRLAPANPWPAGAEDVASVIQWTKREAEGHGGDANRLFLIGQSAGASHSAAYIMDPRFQAPSGVGVTASVLMSGGTYRVTAPLSPNAKAYFGTDESKYEAQSPVTHVGKSKVPLLITIAEYDPGALASQSFDLARAVTVRDGKAPQFSFFRGHNHVSTVQSLGSGQDDVGGRIRDFLGGF